MASIEPLGREDGFGRRLFLMQVPTLEPLPSALGIGSAFAAFVAADATGTTGTELLAFGKSLVGAGAVYVCAYGPGCGDLEDAVDEAVVLEDQRLGVERPVIMTTSHPGEPLSEAVEFFLRSAFPDRAYASVCRSALAITVGNATDAEAVKSTIEQLT